MALTNDEKQELLNAIKAESQSVDELTEVTSLDGVNSLPAMKGNDLVSVPVSLLRKPAEDAATQAIAAKDAANQAVADVIVATTNAQSATTEAQSATTAAQQATDQAQLATIEAEEMMSSYSTAVKLAQDGASARFVAVVSNVTLQASSATAEMSGDVVWDEVRKVFLYRVMSQGDSNAPNYYSNWVGADMYMNADRSAPLKDKTFIMGDALYVWSEEEDDMVEISGSGGGNVLNVTTTYPLTSGFYTLATAIAAVEEKLRTHGLCITYQVSLGKWETKQFVGTALSAWTSEASWEDFGGAGTIKSVVVNGVNHLPDGEGNVIITIDEVSVDESLDASSTNPVQNAAVAGKLSELEASTIFAADAELSEDESSVRLRLTNKSGAEIVSVDLPAGSGGGGGGESATTKIVLGASVNNTTIKEGGDAMLTWSYDHQNAAGDGAGQSTGQKAEVTITVRRGATTTYEETKTEVSKGTYTMDLSKYLLLGTNDVYVVAVTTDPTTGRTQRRQAYISVRSVSLSLSSSYNLATKLAQGGYTDGDIISVPYAVTGSGLKTVTLYINGIQRDAHTVTRSGTTNSNFSIEAATLSSGKHSVQLVAEMEATEGLILKSESIYFDICIAGDNAPFIGVYAVQKDGSILRGQNVLTLTVGQYESCEFRFVAYDPTATPATVIINRDGATQTVSVPRAVQTYTNRFTEKGVVELSLQVGDTSYPMRISVYDSGIELSEVTYGLEVKLSPTGRSNEESNPAIWESNGVQTVFEGFDWGSNGWTGNSLKLSNGARAIIGYQPFKNDIGATGGTIEFEFKLTNVLERGAEVISCMDAGKGLSVTTEEASIKTGVILNYINEDGEDASREIKIGTKYAPEEWLKVAFVIGKRSEGRLMELYVNGNRAGADIYDNSYYFQQEDPQGITINSQMADVELRNIRIYNRALSDDEVLENRMVDADSTDDMMQLWKENDIIGETGDVDLDKLRTQGKGVMRIVREGGLDPVYQTNNKKTDFAADIYFYSPFGKDYDFVLRDCYIRIQGTSSTKYPAKNIRIYMAKGGANRSLTVNGQPAEKYQMRPGAVPMNLFCMKCDYSDSSMSLNTGGAKLFNDVMMELGLMTPPQLEQYQQGGESYNSVSVRQSIDGFPIDIFASETVDGESVYYGQYNFNNEKSKSGKLFGMEDDSVAMTLETLNNTEKVCLFQSTSDGDLAANFDAGLETNIPDDVGFSGLSDAQRDALFRLFRWIRSCVPSGASSNDISSWVSQKFKDEIANYFDVDHLLTYYIHTDYFASVDQRAKNMLIRTWDGLKWYITYYDGDTQLGKRNDCFLAYDYTVDRDTWDAEASKYAFEGRDSWLWNLVLANLQDDLKRCATNYRGKMTNERVLKMLVEEQMANWSDRAYNKSGYLKYIRPAMVETYGKKWPFIYALQGSNKAFLTYFIRNRFALLDAKYSTSSFTSDNIDLYMSRTANDAPDVVRVTANEVYAFGYGTNNSPSIGSTGIVNGGSIASLRIDGAYTVNDPLRIYGASRMRVLDMREAANHLKNGLDLGKCTVLRELNLHTTGEGSTGWWLNLSSCRQLRYIDLYGQQQAKTGSATSTELDLSNQTKLETLDARRTKVQSVAFAKGAPLTRVQLPATITSLRLEYLTQLGSAAIGLEGYTNVRTLVVDNCPLIDWEQLLARCSNLERLRVTGINKEDDGTWLNQFMQMGGVDAEGNATDTCALVGTVRLTRYIDEAEYQAMRAHFPELNITLPEYTTIEFDESVADDANVSNLDNGTGYKFGNAYQPSGHIATILSRRHRCLAKVTTKPTTRSIVHAGVDTIANNLDGTATIYPLHDDNSNYYADAATAVASTPARLDGSEGDVMMYEPHYWFKGINDLLAGKHYSCYSSLDARPATGDATVLTLEDIQATPDGFRSGYKVMSGKDGLRNSLSADSNYHVCRVAVAGYKKVRFPTVLGTNFVGSIFVNESGGIVNTIVVSPLGATFENGMYVIADVPEGATELYFSIHKSAEFDKVVLSNSNRIEDMEPEWVEHHECLTGVFGSSIVGTKLSSCITGGSTAASMTWVDFHFYSVQRGMQQIDYNMHRDIANLFYAKYGRRDSQMQCGAGSHTNSRTTGGTALIGMQDTVNTDGVTVGGTEGAGLAFYHRAESNGEATFVRINNTNCLGYEDIYGHKWDMMDGVEVNKGTVDGKWVITNHDGTQRKVKGGTASGIWIRGVVHGRHMDIITAGSASGSSSTYYCDQYYYSGAQSRVVYRGYSYASPVGGVSYAYAGVDSSYSYTYIGSRLAFRGQIVKAQSVTAYKAAQALA